MNSGDYETRMYEFLYSNSRPCSGHGVSAQWNKERPKSGQNIFQVMQSIQLIKVQKYFGRGKKTNLNAEILGTCSSDISRKSERFIEIYQAGEDVVLEKLDALPPSSREFAVSNSEICKDVIKRIKSSIAAFEFNKEFRNAFQLANLAMAEQSGWNAGSEIFSWRPFNLHLYLVLESFIDENSQMKRLLIFCGSLLAVVRQKHIYA